MLLGKQWIREEIKEEIKRYYELNDNGNNTIQHLWDAVKAVLTEVYSNKILSQETKQI